MKSLLATAATLTTLPAWSKTQHVQVRTLALKNLHTGESLRANYWAGGEYLSEEMQQVDHVLRDHRSGESHPMDPKLIDTLYVIQQLVGVDGPYHVISGYRSPASNAQLRASSSGVARNSFHMQGRAIDICLPGCELKHLRDAALSLRAGGVGYYPGSNFIHVDTGKVRHW